MFRNRETAAAASSGALGSPVGAATSSDVTSGSDPTFTDVCSVSASGTGFLIYAICAGLGNGSGTPRARVLIDNAETNGCGSYGTAYVSGSGASAHVLARVTGLSTGSHTFKLQIAHGGTSWTVHASTNPTREIGNLVVVPITG